MSKTNLPYPEEFYFTSWINRPLETAYRFHWDRWAINPRRASGAQLEPSAAPFFGPSGAHRVH